MFSRALKYGFLVFLLTAPTVMAQEKLEVIPLKNRRVEDVIPIIRPLLGRNEKVSGMRDQLICAGFSQKTERNKDPSRKNRCPAHKFANYGETGVSVATE